MKLDTVDVARFKYRRVVQAVVARRRSRGIQRRIIAVRKIKVRIHVAYQLRGRLRSNLVPAHMRNARAAREAANSAFEQSEATLIGSFLARLKERLQAEADPKKRHAGADAIEQRFANMHCIKRTHHLAEVTHTRKNDLRSEERRVGKEC